MNGLGGRRQSRRFCLELLLRPFLEWMPTTQFVAQPVDRLFDDVKRDYCRERRKKSRRYEHPKTTRRAKIETIKNIDDQNMIQKDSIGRAS